MGGKKWPGDPKDINPMVVQEGPREIGFIEHHAGEEGIIEYDVNTLEALPIRWPHGPIKLPDKLMEVDQPYINTCSQPTTSNRGCPSWRGCPYRAYRGIGPFNLIVRRKTRTEYIPCYNYYYTRGSDGYRQATMSYKTEGWEIDTSTTKVRWLTAKKFTNEENGRTFSRLVPVDVEVPDLGPMYDHLKEHKNGSGEDSTQERPQVSRGPGDGGDRPVEDSETSGGGGSPGDGEGRERTEGRDEKIKLGKTKPARRPKEKVRSGGHHGSKGERPEGLRAPGDGTPEAGVGTKGSEELLLREIRRIKGESGEVSKD